MTGFNRPDLLSSTLSRLREFECNFVFVSIDGPSNRTHLDLELVNKCRDLAEKFNSSNPERNRFLKVNQGCGLAMSSAINWFFSNVNAGVIIEDDILFNYQFLETMDLFLDKFEHNLKVGSVSGYNPFSEFHLQKLKIDFRSVVQHSFFSSWGWATWKNRWDLYEYYLEDWDISISKIQLIRRFGLEGAIYWSRKFDQVARQEIDTWDYQYLAMQLRHNFKCVIPGRNLISNVGFRNDATHTKVNHGHIFDLSEAPGPFDSSSIVSGSAVDREILRTQFKVPGFGESVASAVRRKLTHKSQS